MWSESIAYSQRQANSATYRANLTFERANKYELEHIVTHIRHGFEASPSAFTERFEQRAGKLTQNKYRRLRKSISKALKMEQFLDDLKPHKTYLKEIQGKKSGLQEFNHSLKRLFILARKHKIV